MRRGETVASFSRRSTIRGETENRSAISATVLPLWLSAWKAANWSAGCGGTRTLFSAVLSSSALASSSQMAHGTGKVFLIAFFSASVFSARQRRPPTWTS